MSGGTDPDMESSNRPDEASALFRSMPEPVVFVELLYDAPGQAVDYRILDVNPAWEETFGIARQQAVGATASALPGLDPRAVLPTLSLVAFTGKPARVEMASDALSRQFLTTAVRTSPRALALILEDITERRKIERHLRDAQRLEAIGQLASGVAHDFNNLLTAILGYSELLLASFDQHDVRRHDVEEIRKAGERAASLNRQLLAFSRRRRIQPVPVSLNHTVADMENMLRRLLGEDIELVTSLPPGVSAVRADPGQIEQLILNLIVNARDAMPKGGFVYIETRMEDLGTAQAARLNVAPGSHVVLTIRDTGVGMDQATQAHAFDAFFTTKEHGTGLGLATVQTVVTQSGGGIHLESRPQQGASFSVYFPAIEEPVERSDWRPASEAPRGSGTILLVEDQEAVRELARRVLEEGGYSVLEAGEAQAAMALADHFEGVLDLVFTDVVLPGIDGRELVRRLRSRRPGLKALYTSGAADPAAPDAASREGPRFVQKPFTPSDLLVRIREALNEPAGRG